MADFTFTAETTVSLPSGEEVDVRVVADCCFHPADRSVGQMRPEVEVYGIVRIARLDTGGPVELGEDEIARLLDWIAVEALESHAAEHEDRLGWRATAGGFW